MLGIFALGIVVGRLVLENWPLLLVSGVVVICLLLLLYSERKGTKKAMPAMKQARQRGGK
jgi:hypothetical protein